MLKAPPETPGPAPPATARPTPPATQPVGTLLRPLLLAGHRGRTRSGAVREVVGLALAVHPRSWSSHPLVSLRGSCCPGILRLRTMLECSSECTLARLDAGRDSRGLCGS